MAAFPLVEASITNIAATDLKTAPKVAKVQAQCGKRLYPTEPGYFDDEIEEMGELSGKFSQNHRYDELSNSS